VVLPVLMVRRSQEKHQAQSQTWWNATSFLIALTTNKTLVGIAQKRFLLILFFL